MREGIKLGICGEHGGEPQSVAFCHALGLDYVSCSPYRVPLARLAAAQAALAESGVGRASRPAADAALEPARRPFTMVAKGEVGATRTTAADDLLERAPFLAELEARLDASPERGAGPARARRRRGRGRQDGARSSGSATRRASTRVLWGACDALFTPRPLGPLADIAEAAGGELEATRRRGARRTRSRALLARARGGARRRSSSSRTCTGRTRRRSTSCAARAGASRAAPALVVASYRDDELDRAHPLRIVLGELGDRPGGQPPAARAALPGGGRALAEPHGVDADELYRTTGGNPFFVTEVLAAGAARSRHGPGRGARARGAPDAAGADAARGGRGRPAPAELWLLDALAATPPTGSRSAWPPGCSRASRDGVAFRHELARLAVEESLPPNRGSRCIGRRSRRSPRRRRAPDVARLAHHAEAAGDAEAVLRFAPAAAARAASLGAHREAAAQYARALRFAIGCRRRQRPTCSSAARTSASSRPSSSRGDRARRRRARRLRQVGDRRRRGDALRWLSRLLWFTGRADEAEAAAAAVALLERFPRGRELAMAYANLAQLRLIAGRPSRAPSVGRTGARARERSATTRSRAHALNSVGVAGVPPRRGRGAGEARAEPRARPRGRARRARGARRTNLAGAAVDRAYALAEESYAGGLEYCSDQRPRLVAALPARAAERAPSSTRGAGPRRPTARRARGAVARADARVMALVVLGLVRRGAATRRVGPLDEASGWRRRPASCSGSRRSRRRGPRPRWLEGEPARCDRRADEAFALAPARDGAPG